jgi:radical SAM protein with 4Fe4S-binding SPASM domain
MEQVKNLKAILFKLTGRKLLNIFRIFFSYQLSKITNNTQISGLPFSISIEPTTACNLRCPECPSGLRSFTRPTGMLENSLFEKLIDDIYKDTFFLNFYFQGEPYLNPHFLEMVKYASDKGIYTSTSTNAHYLDPKNARKTVESRLDRLIISIDGTTQEVYENYRIGGKLDKVIEGTKNILEWRRKLNSPSPYVIFQFLIVRPNEHQVEDVKKLALSLGVDEVKFKTAQVYNYEEGNSLIPLTSEFSRYKKDEEGRYKIKNELLNHCWKLWHSCVITWDGTVVPCCFDKDAKYNMGDLKTEKFKDIWNNSNYMGFRKQLLKGRKEIDICRNCSEGTKVWAE